MIVGRGTEMIVGGYGYPQPYLTEIYRIYNLLRSERYTIVFGHSLLPAR